MKRIIFSIAAIALVYTCKSQTPTTNTDCKNCIVSKGVFTPAKVRYIKDIDGRYYSGQAQWDSSFLMQNHTPEMIKSIIADALAGKVDCYAECDSKTKLTLEEVKSKINPPMDTIMVESVDKPGVFDMKFVSPGALSEKTVSSVRFMENWVYNPQTHQIEKKVEWYGFEVVRYAEDGTIKGFVVPLFFKNTKN